MRVEGSDGAHADSRSQAHYDRLAPAQAAIGAAARELKLPTGRDQAAQLAEIAVRERSTLAYLAKILADELDDRFARRRARCAAEARFPHIMQLTESPRDF